MGFYDSRSSGLRLVASDVTVQKVTLVDYPATFVGDYNSSSEQHGMKTALLRSFGSDEDDQVLSEINKGSLSLITADRLPMRNLRRARRENVTY